MVCFKAYFKPKRPTPSTADLVLKEETDFTHVVVPEPSMHGWENSTACQACLSYLIYTLFGGIDNLILTLETQSLALIIPRVILLVSGWAHSLSKSW